ncbi:MAG: DMT family transporter [Pseudomonadota bacterium]|nr:DMT family transporter [Pseudomonadota bacterium]
MMSEILRRVPAETAAVIIMLSALCLAALSGALMKILTDSLSPPLVSWFRFTGYALLLWPVALWRVGPQCFRPARPLVQVTRGLMLAAGNTAFMYGVRHVDYANAISILYIYPFIMVALSAWVLGERVSKSAWLGVAGGFSGVLLVVRPDLAGIDPAALFILFTGMMVALQMLFNRKLGVMSDPVVVSLWGALAATAALSLSLPFVWMVPTTDQMLLIAVLAGLTALSQTLMITAMSMASADRIAPFTYFEIIAAVIIGLVIFDTLPDMLAWVGMALIITSGTVVKRLPGVLKMRRREKF